MQVIRLLAEDTVDALVVEQQRYKMEADAGVLADDIDNGTIVTLAEKLGGRGEGDGEVEEVAAAAVGDGEMVDGGGGNGDDEQRVPILPHGRNLPKWITSSWPLVCT